MRVLPFIVALAAFASAGCKRPSADGSYPALAAMPELQRCTSNVDCTVSCVVNGSCCRQRCQCFAAYNKTYFDKVQARNRDYCKGFVCKRRQITCGAPSTRVIAICQKGRCTSKQVPLGKPSDQRAPPH